MKIKLISNSTYSSNKTKILRNNFLKCKSDTLKTKTSLKDSKDLSK